MKNYTIATLTAARNSVSEMLNVKFASGLKFYGLGSDDRKMPTENSSTSTAW